MASNSKRHQGRNSDPLSNLSRRSSPRTVSPLASPNTARSSSQGQPRPDSPLDKMFVNTLSASESSPATSEKEAELVDVNGTSSQKKKKKTECPCGKSSDGQEWVLTCPDCQQVWHSTCCGLKADFTKPVLNSLLKSWSCPWCYHCPFQKPSGHISEKYTKELKEKLLSAETVQKITDSVTDIVTRSLQTPDFEALSNLMTDFNREVQDYKNSLNPTPSLTQPNAIPSHTQPALKTDIAPYERYSESFLTEGEMSELSAFLQQSLESGKFRKENGRSVLTMGHSYSYTGSKSPQTPPEIPPLINSIIDKLVSSQELSHRPNSILVNHYPDTSNSASSYLPHHSDDESTILADSEIATITIGGTREITFQHLHDPSHEEVKLSPKSNSVYLMTRKSQAWFKHGIPATEEEAEERFSLTFRTLSEKFKRSLVIIGDSNSQNIEFGSGKGKVGESYPGKRIRSGYVSQINASDCVGFANVTIVCGTNDLRTETISHPSQITHVVQKLELKLAQIKRLCPKAKITVMPVLPSRLPKMNNNIMQYNNIVGSMLNRLFKDVSFPSVHHMLDNHGLLAMNLTRGGDAIHLGTRGVAKFVSLIKCSVYESEIKEKRMRGNERKQHSAVSSGSPEPT